MQQLDAEPLWIRQVYHRRHSRHGPRFNMPLEAVRIRTAIEVVELRLVGRPEGDVQDSLIAEHVSGRMVSAARAGVLHELEQHVARADDGRLAHGVVQSPQVFMLRRSEEHTSELQSLAYLVCRLLLEKKKKTQKYN